MKYADSNRCKLLKTHQKLVTEFRSVQKEAKVMNVFGVITVLARLWFV